MTRGAAATVPCRLFDTKNGNWTALALSNETPTPAVTAIKDIITAKFTQKPGYDYEVTVPNTRIPGKPSNGKDITGANIKAMLDELKAVFPHGASPPQSLLKMVAVPLLFP